jgi:tetratricopeptide (TPR) repeat protein
LLCALGLVAALGAAPAWASTDAETLWKQGHDAAAKGSLTEAVGFYKQSLAVDPHGHEAMVDLASALTDMERWDDARMAYERAIRVYPDDATALNGLGYVFYRQERFDSAIAYFKRAIARMDDPQFHVNMGLALLSQERYGQAEDQFRRTLEIDPRHYWATNNLGYTLQLEGRADEAMALYTEALRLDPPGVTTHLNFGALLLDQESYDDAATVYTDALKKDDTVAEAHLGLAVALENTDRRRAKLPVMLSPSYRKPRLLAVKSMRAGGCPYCSLPPAAPPGAIEAVGEGEAAQPVSGTTQGAAQKTTPLRRPTRCWVLGSKASL